MIERNWRFRVGTWRLLALTLATVLVASAACSSDDDDDAEDEVPEEDAAGPVRGADVAQPTVAGPVTGGERGQFNVMATGLADRYGYMEEEYFLEGEATSYELEGELSEDGRWDVTEADTAPYRTRIIVRRPADPDDFDGTVFVEWLNVTGGVDVDPDFRFTHPELLGSGSAYIAVSAQRVGVEGGAARPIEVPGAEPESLKEWDPERYGELKHPGDPYSYDIFSQVAQVVRRPGDVDVLDGLDARHLVAMGESQSGGRMLTYVNAVHPVADIYDGFLVHSRGSSGASLVGEGSILGDGVALVRDDLGDPVLQFETETDLFGVFDFHLARQDDTDMLRTWEVAGAAHADLTLLDQTSEMAEGMAEDGGGGMRDACDSINDGPQGQVLRAAVAALRAWVVDGEAPPEAPRLEVEDGAIVRDELGIALGGIRTPAVDAPIAAHSGEAAPGGEVFCMLFGETRPFDADTLADLYPTHEDYADAVTDSAEAAVAAGFLLQADADDFMAEAEAASIPD